MNTCCTPFSYSVIRKDGKYNEIILLHRMRKPEREIVDVSLTSIVVEKVKSFTKRVESLVVGMADPRTNIAMTTEVVVATIINKCRLVNSCR